MHYYYSSYQIYSLKDKFVVKRSKDNNKCRTNKIFWRKNAF